MKMLKCYCSISYPKVKMLKCNYLFWSKEKNLARMITQYILYLLLDHSFVQFQMRIFNNTSFISQFIFWCNLSNSRYLFTNKINVIKKIYSPCWQIGIYNASIVKWIKSNRIISIKCICSINSKGQLPFFLSFFILSLLRFQIWMILFTSIQMQKKWNPIIGKGWQTIKWFFFYLP